MTERISELFDYGDEIVLEGLDNPFDPAEIKEVTLKKIHETAKPGSRVRVRRVSRTLLLAALLSTLFVTSALAVGLSIHARRQEQLKQVLTQGQDVAGYTEYALPTENVGGVTLLSAVGDGEFELVWLNVSPVEPEEVPRFMQGEAVEGGTRFYDIGCRIRQDETVRGRADYVNSIEFAPEDWITGTDAAGNETRTVSPERMEQRYREQYYDEETKTLTVCLRFVADELQPGEPTELEVDLVTLFTPDGRTEPISWSEQAELVRSFGTTTFVPAAEETLKFLFPEPFVFENPETGGRGEIRGIELVASGVNTYVWNEDQEKIFVSPESTHIAEGQMELWLSWANATEKAMAENVTLHCADGTEALLVPTVAAHRENGIEKLISSGRIELWDIHSVVSVTVGETVYPLSGG